ncbi:DUF4275 family protein [Pyxidicoccus sp. MSG2]|uniref:DUF4275 family protein n=1 Tax=Pyxidicoccus sp. MSG2 TaxID=2996790 RepID=UPI0022710032|nr:DUF4275 family protein [Pyxidicoccus sp. MSG2]MCY1015537.1 DUF4275 family protein [Pyxidicoccus sp. MSG2]
MSTADYIEVLSRCGGSFQELPRRERWRLMQAWRDVYAASLHAQTGAWKRGELDWHVFSFGHAHALRGSKAQHAYALEPPGALLVIPESEALPAVRLEGEGLPDFSLLRQDLYVWPPDLAWTMAFTHELPGGNGPYFSRREWMD